MKTMKATAKGPNVTRRCAGSAPSTGSIKKGQLKRSAYGTAKYSRRGVSCKWGKKKVSENTYNAKLEKAFDFSKAKQLVDLKYISREKVKKKLK